MSVTPGKAIAALRPDLILSSKVRHKAIYDQLARVAPTVFSEEVGVTWKENFALHADALGRRDEATRLQGEYDDKARVLRAALDAGRADTAVLVVRSGRYEVRIYLLKRLQDNRLWGRLDVVQADRVFEVPDDLWSLGIGNFAARKCSTTCARS